MRPEWFQRLASPPAAAPVDLAALAWPEIAALLENGETLALLPVGATEQHGPHLPCDTDTAIATAVCAYASACTGAPVLPPINYGVSIGHTEKWPGTLSLFHETLIAAVREIAAWLAATGFERLIVVNGHCGNDSSLRVAVDRLRFDFAGAFHAATRNTFALSPEIAAEFSSDASDWHANRAETDVMLFLAPDRVQLNRLSTSDDPDRTGGCVFPHMVAHTSTNGVTGKPSGANARRGAQLFQRMGDALAGLVTAARTEDPPLAWSRSLSGLSRRFPCTTNHQPMSRA